MACQINLVVGDGTQALSERGYIMFRRPQSEQKDPSFRATPFLPTTVVPAWPPESVAVVASSSFAGTFAAVAASSSFAGTFVAVVAAAVEASSSSFVVAAFVVAAATVVHECSASSASCSA